MDFLKKDIAKLDNSYGIYWSYSHLEDKNTISNCFDAFVTYNIKENWVFIYLIRYGISSKSKEDYLAPENVWFIKDLDLSGLKYYFNLYDDIEKRIYDKLHKDLQKYSFTLSDFSDSAKQIKKEIESK